MTLLSPAYFYRASPSPSNVARPELVRGRHKYIDGLKSFAIIIADSIIYWACAARNHYSDDALMEGIIADFQPDIGVCIEIAGYRHAGETDI